MIKDIVYASNELYAPLMSVSLVSLFRCNPNIKFRIFILENNISEDSKTKIRDFIIKNNSECIFLAVTEYSSLSSKKLEVHKLSLSTYSRLLLTKLLPEEVSRVFYIDCDTVINGDISELLKTNLENVGFAGVEDAIDPIEKDKIGLSRDIRYVNAGILLINLDYWRKEHLFEQFSQFIEKYNGKVPFLDQGIINGVIKDRSILPLRYNVQAPIYATHKYGRLLRYFHLDNFYDENEYKECKQNPTIIHFTSFYIGRPWYSHCKHPFRKLFYEFAKESPVAVPIWENKESITMRLKNAIFFYLQPLYFFLKK